MKEFRLNIPEGWLGNFEEWPILFFRDHEIQRSLARPELKAVLSTVCCYCCLEDYGDKDLDFVLLSALPDIGRKDNKITWLEYESQINDPATFWNQVREELGGSYLYNTDSETPLADLAFQRGLCPGQWFVLKLSPNYIHYYTSDMDEWDFGIKAELTDREKLSPKEHLIRWSEFIYGIYKDNPRYGIPKL